MVLTPDQKRRIAELDSQVPPEEEKQEPHLQPLLGRFKELTLKLRARAGSPTFFKALIIIVAVAVAGYFFREYQLHRLNFKKIIESQNPVQGFISAIEEQKRKNDLVDQARAEFLGGDYAQALATAASVTDIDNKDSRAQNLLDIASDAAVQRANREFDTGEVEAALADVRLAMKYRPQHEGAQQLSLRIAERLYREAQAHYSKNEYAPLIKKAKEVIKINPSDIGASTLLLRTNNELLTQADELLYKKRFFEALEKVRLSLQIEPTNSRALRLLNQISLYVETPDIKLRGITRFGKTPYAIVQLPNSNQPTYVKKGETVRNFKLLDIDPDSKTAKFLQIYTKAEFDISLSKPE
ncbi:MAG: hypothetical protein C4520_09980 [Candidatus Abyssobacteria bacterium SURF_5]|uniref:Tetratricopeptide repeat protein n=1 Tax=Abyssobacteria bacterium (strain SURF_5) TaxID=2093360 RepID=A0A3A4NKY1_ABYX5|nr:MAG: hypothetical protein C4520_09980 [Candidatus Abyssubacteria bacterium SURF_5]